MYHVKQEFTETLEVKQSKFIAHLIPFSLYTQTLDSLKQEHPKARHFVTAYRYLNEYDQIVEHSSDDGEPSGTSGKPSLMVLQGSDLINTAVIVVRYFGGTKLGTGGLVRAYSDAVNLVVQKAELFTYTKELKKKIIFAYGDVRFIDYSCQELGIDIVEKSFNDKVEYIIQGSDTNIQTFLEKTKRLIELKSI